MSVFKSARIVFTSLRIGGTFPYLFKGVEATKEAESIQFRTFSWVSGWTLCMILIKMLVGYEALYSNAEEIEDTAGGTDTQLSERLTNSYEGLVTKTLLNSLCIHSMYQSVLPLLKLRQELKLSYLWEEFHSCFRRTVGTVRQCQLRKATVFATVQLILICVPVIIITFGNVSGRKIKEDETEIAFAARLIYIALRTVVTMLFPQMEDLRFFIHCYFIQLYSGEIKVAMQNEISVADGTMDSGVLLHREDPKSEKSRTLQKRISGRKLEDWHSLIAAIHKIASTTGKVMGMPQILSTLHDMFIVTLTAYASSILLIEVISQGSVYIFMYYGLGVAFFYLFRTFQRCYISQMISNQEHEILLIIESIQHDQFDVLAKQEARFLLECLQNRPCSVSLSGYMEANNKLFLQILGTILTYVIVLLQFKDVYRQ